MTPSTGDESFDNEYQALKAGMVIGALLKAGFKVHLGTDDSGVFKNIIEMGIDLGDDTVISVEICVLP